MASLDERLGEVPALVTNGAKLVYTAEDHTAKHAELWTALSGEGITDEVISSADEETGMLKDPVPQIDLEHAINVGRGVTSLFVLAEVEKWREGHEARKTESLRRRQRRDRERKAPVRPYVLANGEVIA